MAKNNKLKILMCINNLQKGGAEKQFLYIFEYLEKFYDVNIFLINGKGLNRTSKNIKKKISVGYLNYFFIYLITKLMLFCFFTKVILIVWIHKYFFPKLKKLCLEEVLITINQIIFISLQKYFFINLQI